MTIPHIYFQIKQPQKRKQNTTALEGEKNQLVYELHALTEDKIRIVEEIWINSLRFNKFHSPRFKSCAIQRIHQICYRDKTEIEARLKREKKIAILQFFGINKPKIRMLQLMVYN